MQGCDAIGRRWDGGVGSRERASCDAEDETRRTTKDGDDDSEAALTAASGWIVSQQRWTM